MNQYISAQISNMIAMAKTFKQACTMAAYKNDGRIDKQEEKTLAKIKKANQAYIKELEKIKG